MERIFIETLSVFQDSEDENLSKKYWGEYVFAIDNIVGYNKSTQGYTTIDLKNDGRWEIAIKYEEFKKIMNNYYKHEIIIDAKANYEFKEQQR